MENNIHLSTRIIHEQTERFSSVVEPLVLSTTFLRNNEGFYDGDIYARSSNPNRRSLENKLAILEKGETAICFSSGQAATLAVFQSLGANAHIILPDDIYFGTKAILSNLLSNFNITFSICDYNKTENIENNLNGNTKLIWIESPLNPQLKIADIEEIVILAIKNNILTACNNTWATPLFTNPLDYGVNLVVHSSTKYFGGHSDIIGGVVVTGKKTPEDITESIKKFQTIGGAIPSPFDCWLLNRSLSTFIIRVEKQTQNAQLLAEFFNNHPKIIQTNYPSLSSHPQHDLAKKHGFGAMLSILYDGNETESLKLCTRLKIFKNATSLGGIESMVDHRKSNEGPNSSTPENLIRISVGIENIEDLINDFKQAIDND